MCKRWYITSAVSGSEVIGYFTQSKAHFPCTALHQPPQPLLTTASPAANSFDAKSPPTADHFSFIWEKSHRPLMSSQRETTSREHLSFKALSCFTFELMFKSYIQRDARREREREVPFKKITTNAAARGCSFIIMLHLFRLADLFEGTAIDIFFVSIASQCVLQMVSFVLVYSQRINTGLCFIFSSALQRLSPSFS